MHVRSGRILALTLLLAGCDSAPRQEVPAEPQTVEAASAPDSELLREHHLTASEALAQGGAERERRVAEGQCESAIISGETLMLFDEPSLPERLKRYGPPQTYRFFWFRTNRAPVAIRVDVSYDLSVITVKATDGLAGIVTGDLLLNRNWQLSEDEQDELLKAVDRFEFWMLPSEEEECDGCVDGSIWIIEGARPTLPTYVPQSRQYHCVSRFSPDSGPVRELGLLFLRLADLEADVF